MLTIIVLTLASLILGYIKFSSIAPSRKGWSWQLNFIEYWNCSVNFFVVALIAYYFWTIRWAQLANGDSLNLGDILVFTFFLLGLFGHLNVFSFNITRGIEAIIDRYFKG